MNTIDWESLFATASRAQEHAYVPYSKLKVGAALLSRTGEVFCGCNVENASLGLTICAERAAVVQAIAAGVREFVGLALLGGSEALAPCGACRQFLAEFGNSLLVCSRGAGGSETRWRLVELLPHSFGDFRPS